jgi:tRNA dimethylallyltransferase
MPSDKLVLILVGPTASGKTALLDGLFGSAEGRRRYGLPEALVISADSMQAYRGMDIGTAKPASELRARLPHRLLDIRDIREQYTAGDFVRLADEACAEAAASSRLPIVSGGTGFYVRNFLCGLPTAPASDPAAREAVARDLAERGPSSLRAELAATDPDSAARIHGRDLYRLTRALEIVRATGRPLADFAAGSAARANHRFAVLALAPPPGELAARIGARVDGMMAAGLAEEVAALRALGYAAADPGMKAIGYREFFETDCPEGRPTERKLEGIVERIKLDTRRYAKRQMTFFRGLPGVEWIPADASEAGRRIASIARDGRADI